MKILVINGPNINMLGIREPEIYGSQTYADLVKMVEDFCSERGIEVKCFQSNHEGAIIDCIQQAYGKYDGIVINPAAYTHTSIAIADAIKAVSIPTVEVHISNLAEREDYRQVSYINEHCVTTFSGLGFNGYLCAIDVITAQTNA